MKLINFYKKNKTMINFYQAEYSKIQSDDDGFGWGWLSRLTEQTTLVQPIL